MDLLRPGHSLRSSSDRLLSNYLDSQKALASSLLTLLSHSHSSTSSLLAYVTSSPGVVPPVRKSVRHAGFEGPLSGALLEAHGSQMGSAVGMDETQGWAAYITANDRFRKDLKQIHALEEEMGRVKRDKEILVTRLIKTTKSRPTRSDLTALANNYSQTNMSSRMSQTSFTSAGSASTVREGKRTTKLAEAQAELLGCEEHLRVLEVKIEHERNKVMMRGLEEKFRSMEAVGRMWVSQAKKGLDDLEKAHDLPANAFELDSNNGSIAPSQSASQIGYEDASVPAPRRAFPKSGIRGPNGPGSITGSIQEEDEGSSSDDGAPRRKLVVHENRSGAATPRPANTASAKPNLGRTNSLTRDRDPAPRGVPSVTAPRNIQRPMSATFGQDDSDSDVPNDRAGGRRAMSDVGAMSYTPITKRHSLRRALSADRRPASPSRRSQSSGSSIRGGGMPVKKKGFFASIGRFFKGPSGGNRRGSVQGRDSPTFGTRSKGGWNTRTNSNLKSGGLSLGRGGRGGRGGDSSSEDEGGGGFVSVSNNRAGWSVENVGRGAAITTSAAAERRQSQSNLPVASGLIPANPRARAGSDAGVRNGRTTPTQASIGRAGGASVGRSNTLKSSGSVGNKSTASAGMKPASSAGTLRSNTGSTRRARQTGTGLSPIANQPATAKNNIMSLVTADPKNPSAPIMPDVPRAPKSQVTPSLELPKAPGSSIVRPGDPHREVLSKDEIFPHQSISRNNSMTKVPQVKRSSSRAEKERPASQQQVREQPDTDRSQTPLPPSKMLSPPLKSALRPSSPTPLAPPVEMPKTLISVTAPGPVEVPRDEMPKPSSFPVPLHPSSRPRPGTRQSYMSGTTEEGMSVYESAEEGRGDYGAESSSDEDDEAEAKYKAVDNDRVKKLGIQVGPPAVERIPSNEDDELEYESEEGSVDTAQGGGDRGQAAGAQDGEKVNRRRSVRIKAPNESRTSLDQPSAGTAPATQGQAGSTGNTPSSPTQRGAPVLPGQSQSQSQAKSSSTRSAGARPRGNGKDSPEPEKMHEQWSTRIGRMREDTSDEDSDEGDQAGYRDARRGLAVGTGRLEEVMRGGEAGGKGRGAAGGGGGGTRSKGSVKR